MKRCLLVPWCCALLLTLAAGASAQDRREEAQQQDPRHANIMPLADVKVGMKGYGRTVFQGTDIEPFAIEVMSVVSGDEP